MSITQNIKSLKSELPTSVTLVAVSKTKPNSLIEEAYAAGESYFPETMPEMNYYQPVNRGLEIKIKEKLAHLRELDQKTGKKG